MVRERDLPVKPPPALEVKQRGYWRAYVLATNAEPPLTFAFHTASGASGLLQITEFTQKPNSAQLRFKLAQVAAVSKPETGKSVFGPVIEKVVTGLIDLDAGTLVDWPLPEQAAEAAPVRYAWINNEDPQARPWMRERGIDAVDANHGLCGVDLLFTLLKNNDWQRLTPDRLREQLRHLPQPQSLGGLPLSDNRGTYAFQTREGSLGVLQVSGAADGPRGLPSPGVKIRYKLVQGR